MSNSENSKIFEHFQNALKSADYKTVAGLIMSDEGMLFKHTFSVDDKKLNLTYLLVQSIDNEHMLSEFFRFKSQFLTIIPSADRHNLLFAIVDKFKGNMKQVSTITSAIAEIEPNFLTQIMDTLYDLQDGPSFVHFLQIFNDLEKIKQQINWNNANPNNYIVEAIKRGKQQLALYFIDHKVSQFGLAKRTR